MSESFTGVASDANKGAFEGWVILELFGHRRLGGYVEEQEVAGSSFLRIDVHGEHDLLATQLYSPQAVYAITPTTERMARAAGERSVVRPLQPWELPAAGIAGGSPGEPLDEEDEGLPF